MAKKKFRIERDSMGAMKVPSDALWAAQTQRNIANFPISGQRFPRAFLEAIGLVKGCCAAANAGLGLMKGRVAKAVQAGAWQVAAGEVDDHFPLDVFQTGSGTNTNMNANEVIAALASKHLKAKVHPNDQVNMCQSSNDVIPTTIHVAAHLETSKKLIPALKHLEKTIRRKAKSVDTVVKTGRTHLMDAMPVRLSQELGAWATQIGNGVKRLESTLPRIAELAIGGTAVGTGINAPKAFGPKVAAELKKRTGIAFKAAPDRFEKLAAQDAAVELSGQLKTIAVSFMKIANDLRWMNSGPNCGLGEITLEGLAPGSSIMPGKINPIIPEATAMVCARVIGNDATIAIAGQSGNFQLNVMLPVLAFDLLQSIEILTNTAGLLADKTIAGFAANKKHVGDLAERNPILVTALNPITGYDLGAKIAKRAYREGRKVKEVAAEMTTLSNGKLDRLLDPAVLTRGGVLKK
ncbi:MAG: aspartate ammonia-lyase [Elusimicrobia bacterium]|nr:MAG: aspartate ammonia-lyase [Elusimicrobiota bacterium]